MQYDNLPQDLRNNGVFCLWRYEERKKDNKLTKVPYQISGSKAMPNNIRTFSDYAAAIAVVDQYDGLGIGVFRGFCAVDIDHCIDENGNLTEMAQKIAELFSGCYIEKSPSGTGLRIIFLATGFKYNTPKYYINNQKIGLEVYVFGATNRFVTVTGNVFQAGAIIESEAALQKMLDMYMLRSVKAADAPCKSGSVSYLTDDSVIAKASAAKNSDIFMKLWEGDIRDYASHSEADLALCSLLAFWCGRDIEQMDRLFRESGLMREKWDRAQSGTTYGRITLEKAAANCSSSYAPMFGIEDDFGQLSEQLQLLHPSDNKRYSWADNGAGRLFADIYKPCARFVPERKSWYIYDDTRWKVDTGSLRVMEWCKGLADALTVYALGIRDERDRKSYLDYCSKWQIRGVRLNVLSDAQSVYPISMEKFDTDRYLFNCVNGTLDLRTMQFRDHSPEDRLTKIASVKYDPKAVCPRFERFIDEIMSSDKEKAMFLQKALGYAVSGDTRFECMFFLYGETTRNGKGTLMESILHVLGDYGKAVRPETIALKQYSNSQAPSEDIARLAGVR